MQNPDIIAEVAAHQNRPRCVVGFAAETQHCWCYPADFCFIAVADAGINYQSDRWAVRRGGLAGGIERYAWSGPAFVSGDVYRSDCVLRVFLHSDCVQS